MLLKQNPLIELFKKRQILSENDLELFHSGTRDIKEIDVLIHKQTECLILDKCLENLEKYYSQNENYSKGERYTLIENEFVKTPPLEDNLIRYDIYKEFLINSSVLDFGCGKGGFLELLQKNNISKDLTGLELNQVNNRNIRSIGIPCLYDLNDCDSTFDYIFLNHVFEHLENPIRVLEDLLSRLNTNGKIIIEIPHGNDFLIKKSEIDVFKDFTFWSEHLCLYNEKFIDKFFKIIGINDYHVSYRQRYNLNNHIYWFKEGKPGGHKKNLFTGSIIEDYNKYLIKQKETDTLMIVIGTDCEDFSKKVFKN